MATFNHPDEIANQRGIATEPYIDEFVEKVGGKRLDTYFPNPAFLNADYIFEKQKVVIELKIIETEFGEASSFRKKRKEIIKEIAKKFPLGESIRWEKGPREYYAKSLIELYRAPLARIAKKANRQIRESKHAIGSQRYRGVLWLVNDGFTNLGTDTVFAILVRILNGSSSQIRGLIYVTNHYVHIPGNDFANLLWAPVYADHAADDLPDFVNWLGEEWSKFMEEKTGPFDNKVKTEDVASILGTRPIR